MRKILSVLLTAAVLVCFAACGAKTTSEPEDKGGDPAASAEQSAAATETRDVSDTGTAAQDTGTEDTEGTGTDDESYEDHTVDIGLLMINGDPYAVGAEECFATGVTAMICDRTATYSFKSSSEDVNWKIFILDEPFTDAARYLPQSRTADLDGDGTLEIAEGKYVYVYCGVNSFTTDAPSDATLTIDIA